VKTRKAVQNIVIASAPMPPPDAIEPTLLERSKYFSVPGMSCRNRCGGGSNSALIFSKYHSASQISANRPIETTPQPTATSRAWALRQLRAVAGGDAVSDADEATAVSIAMG
jgi:hypothetical protein